MTGKRWSPIKTDKDSKGLTENTTVCFYHSNFVDFPWTFLVFRSLQPIAEKGNREKNQTQIRNFSRDLAAL